MNETLFDHYIDEIIYSGRENDVVKLSFLAEQFPELIQQQQHRAVEMAFIHVDKETILEATTKIILLGQVVQNDNILLRVALEELLPLYPHKIATLIESLKSDQKETLLFLLNCAIESGESSVAPSLQQRLRRATDEKETTLLLKALGELGTENEIHTIAEYLYSDNSTFQIAAIKALAAMRLTKAVELLGRALERDVSLAPIIINSMIALGEPTAYYILAHHLSTNNSRIRSFLSQKLVSLGSIVLPEMLSILQNSITDNHLIALLGVIRDIGSSKAAKYIRKLIHKHHINPNVRVAAYETLAAIDYKSSAFVLLAGLDDPVDDVAFAVASALNDNLDEHIKEGLHHFVFSGIYPIKRFGEIFLFSHATTIVKELMREEVFKNEIYALCQQPQMAEFREIYSLSFAEEEEEREEYTLWAIDDSKVILMMYRQFASHYGVRIKTFSSGQEGLDALREERPPLIYVDLNMPYMSGIEFAEEVRKQYPKSELPLILVTTQSDVEKDCDLSNNLFSEICYKPFTIDLLTTITDRYKDVYYESGSNKS